MGVFGSILDAFKSIFKKVVHFVVEFVKQYWMIIVAIAAIYFAPALLAWATAANAPAWLVAGLQGLTSLTPYLTAALETGMAAYTWAVEAWEALGIWYQLAFTAGAMFVLAPEEMKEVAREISEEVGKGGAALAAAVGSAAAAVGGGLASGLVKGAASSGFVPLAAGALALWWFVAWRRRRKEDNEDKERGVAKPYDFDDGQGGVISALPSGVAIRRGIGLQPGRDPASFGPRFVAEGEL